MEDGLNRMSSCDDDNSSNFFSNSAQVSGYCPVDVMENGNTVSDENRSVKKEEDEGSSSSVMAQLFSWDLDHILREIFLYLDPLSLKYSRLTCTQWNRYIRDRIWKSRKIKSVLRKRMWNEFLPNRTIISKTKGSITSMDTDDYHCIVGLTDGTCQVFENITGNLIRDLDDRKEGVVYCSTQVCLFNNLVGSCACGSDSRLHFRVTVWRREMYDPRRCNWPVLKTFDYAENVRFVLSFGSVFISASYETIRWTTKGDVQFLPIKKASLRLLSLDRESLAAWDGKVLSVWDLSDPAHLMTTISCSFPSLATFLLSYHRLYIMDRDNLYIWSWPEDLCVRRIPHHHHHHSSSWGACGGGSLVWSQCFFLDYLPPLCGGVPAGGAAQRGGPGSQAVEEKSGVEYVCRTSVYVQQLLSAGVCSGWA